MMGHSHDVPARRHFLKMSARLAALGLTSLGVQPARQFFVRDVKAQSGSSSLYTGWGGRLLDLFGATDSLAAVSVSSPAIFLEGADVRSNVIPPGASLSLNG